MALEIEREQATVEVAILQELKLLLPIAMARLPEIVSQIAYLIRQFGVRVAERRDAGALNMVTLHFNTFLRQALKLKNNEAFYTFVYQYRRLAEQLLQTVPEHSVRLAFFLDYYGHQAVRMGVGFLINVIAYDLASLCDAAFACSSPRRRKLLEVFLHLDRDMKGVMEMPGVVKSQIILAAKLKVRAEEESYQRLVVELGKVPLPMLKQTFSDITVNREEKFWEIANRRRHLDHVEPAYREAVQSLRVELLGPTEPGTETLLFLEPARRASQPAVPSLRSSGRLHKGKVNLEAAAESQVPQQAQGTP